MKIGEEVKVKENACSVFAGKSGVIVDFSSDFVALSFPSKFYEKDYQLWYEKSELEIEE